MAARRSGVAAHVGSPEGARRDWRALQRVWLAAGEARLGSEAAAAAAEGLLHARRPAVGLCRDVEGGRLVAPEQALSAATAALRPGAGQGARILLPPAALPDPEANRAHGEDRGGAPAALDRRWWLGDAS